jgi:hypothetical protein
MARTWQAGAKPGTPTGLRWRKVRPGNHMLTAKATDSGGAVGTSPPVHITVRAKPRAFRRSWTLSRSSTAAA